ncbi:MAG: hypothetical protein KME52_13520 [Desmonostoc geniculatum HA4340-LM1]|jgi:hypothetical protein|nr:hypothetical protein [Desmonostoc geniculatum HA4340-LM1]
MNVNALPIDPSVRYIFLTDLWDEPWTAENAEVIRYTLFHDPEPSICSLCPQILSSWGDRSCDTRNAFLRYIEAPLDFRVLNEVLTASGALGFRDDEMVNAIATHICSTEYCVPLNVINALNYSSDLCKIIAARRSEYEKAQRLEKLQRLLEELLAAKEYPPPSLQEIAKRLGKKSVHSLDKYFPDLCSAISARYTTYRQELQKKRVEKLRQEVRQVAFQLHSEATDY